MKALRAANDGSAISDVIDMLNNLPNEVGSAESFNQEALVEKQFNRQFSSEGHSDEQTSEGHSDEQTAQDSGSKLVASSATNFQLEGLLSPKTKFLYAYGVLFLRLIISFYHMLTHITSSLHLVSSKNKFLYLP